MLTHLYIFKQLKLHLTDFEKMQFLSLNIYIIYDGPNNLHS